jgi:hypothetical protein
LLAARLVVKLLGGSVMRTHTWLTSSIAGLVIALGIAACMDEAPPVEEPTSSVTEEVYHPITFTTYYNDALHHTVVGRCTHSICPQWPKGTFCTGHKTDYFTAEFDTCE